MVSYNVFNDENVMADLKDAQFTAQELREAIKDQKSLDDCLRLQYLLESD